MSRRRKKGSRHVCTYWQGCPEPSLPDWPYCQLHHERVLGRAEQIRRLRDTAGEELESLRQAGGSPGDATGERGSGFPSVAGAPPRMSFAMDGEEASSALVGSHLAARSQQPPDARSLGNGLASVVVSEPPATTDAASSTTHHQPKEKTCQQQQ